MKSFLAVAIEEHASKTEQEKEYSYFVKLTQEQLDAIIKLDGAKVSSSFSETKLPAGQGLSSRLRQYMNDGEAVHELTTKAFTGESKVKEETNDVIHPVNYKALAQLGVSTNIRSRITIPIVKDGEPVMKRNGPLQWEFDLYHLDTERTVCAWAKIELEVDIVALPDIISLIPFEYDELIPSDSTDDEDRVFISHLYNNVYNIQSKTRTVNEVDSLLFS